MSRRRFHKDQEQKEQAKRILIVSEGLVSERDYIEAVKRTLRVASADVTFVPPGPTSPVEIVDRSIALRDGSRSDPYDFVWCVFDTESSVTQAARPRVNEALAKAQEHGIEIALSNPCVELWLLLHEEDQQGWIDSHSCQARCKQIGLVDEKRIVQPDAMYEAFYLAKLGRRI